MKFAHLDHPLLLPLLLILLACSAVYFFVPKARAFIGVSRGLFLLRAVVLTLLCIAVAEPYLEHERQESTALVFLDVSDSMDSSTSTKAMQNVTALGRGEVTLDVVPFADKSAAISFPLQGAGDFRQLQSSWGKLNIGATNVETALSGLLSRPAGSVLLLSDGNETAGDARKLIPQLRDAGYKVFPIVPEDAQNGSLRFHISSLHAPLVAPAQKSVEVRASVQNSSDREQRGQLEITHDKKVIFSQEVVLAPKSEALFTAQSDPSSEGIKEITALLKPEDSAIAASSESIFLSGQARERVLLVSSSEEDARFLKEALQSQAYQLENVIADAKGTSLPDLSKFSSVIFNNVAYDQIAKTSVNLLDSYVKGGGGFIMLGGNRSFGLGGYRGTIVEDILPVELLPPQTIKKRLNLAVELVIDKSRSMSDSDKIEYAKEAAREAIRALKDDDYVGVIGFDASPFVVAELAPLSSNREKASERVGRLFPAGRTNMLPAIEEARRSLLRANAGRKHMIILTDGKIPDEGPYYAELVRQMRLMGITVSTVLLGSDADPGMLETMADVGGGAFYQTSDPRSLPRIFLTDIKVGSGEQTMKEQEYLVRPGTSELRSTTIEAFPPIRGYVETKAKKTANLELVAFGNNVAEPLLASWAYGKGRSLAFTSDANGRWSSGWVPWPKFFTFWSELLDSVRQSNLDSQNIRFDLRYVVEHGMLTLDLSIFSEKPPGGVHATLAMPDGAAREIEFANISPGHYRTRVSDISAGKYTFNGVVDGKKLTPVAFALQGSLFGERRGEGYNMPLLYALADGTGGKINPNAQDIKSQVYKHIERQDLTTWFLATGLLVFLLEILLREVPKLFTVRWKLPRRAAKRQAVSRASS
ncbi:MAG: VWA domain-containing protein [Deltaproteobacteria bacterium]|nr:VWA domain-containing protein [Deltaproteobacteria bacterium]